MTTGWYRNDDNDKNWQEKDTGKPAEPSFPVTVTDEYGLSNEIFFLYSKERELWGIGERGLRQTRKKTIFMWTLKLCE